MFETDGGPQNVSFAAHGHERNGSFSKAEDCPRDYHQEVSPILLLIL
jgi:hypothetical protein